MLGVGAILKEMLYQRPTRDRLLDALADPARRAILEQLNRGPAGVADLERPLAQSVRHHLDALEACGLVRSETVWRVDRAALGTAERWILDRWTSWEHRLDRLAHHTPEQE
jgi:DNA-binding transcriptional ArsR family regulator